MSRISRLLGLWLARMSFAFEFSGSQSSCFRRDTRSDCPPDPVVADIIVLGVTEIDIVSKQRLVEKENDRWINGRIANNRDLQPTLFIVLVQNNILRMDPCSNLINYHCCNWKVLITFLYSLLEIDMLLRLLTKSLFVAIRLPSGLRRSCAHFLLIGGSVSPRSRISSLNFLIESRESIESQRMENSFSTKRYYATTSPQKIFIVLLR